MLLYSVKDLKVFISLRFSLKNYRFIDIYKTKAIKPSLNFYSIFSKVVGCVPADFAKLNPFRDIFQEKVMKNFSKKSYYCKTLFTE